MATQFLCGPVTKSSLTKIELDKFHGPVLLEGVYSHPYLPYSVNATREYMEDLAAKYNKHRANIEVPTPDGHTTDSSKNRGYIDRTYEAKVIEVEIDGKKVAALDMGFDIRDPETIRAAAAGTLGRSVSIHPNYKYSTPDGAVHDVGEMIAHVAFTSDPVVTNMPPLEPVREFDKVSGQEVEFVPLSDKHLASRLVTWQDPPAEVTNGIRKATHAECGYTAGTPEANCDRCLSRFYEYPDGQQKSTLNCEWVDTPIMVSGVCRYFRPRYYSYSVAVPDDCLFSQEDAGAVLVQLAKNAKKPYGEILYADPGFQPDGVYRYPVDTAKHVRAAHSYFGMAKNRKKYSKKQQDQIDSVITKAWKSLIDKKGPQSAQMDSQGQGVNEMDLKQLAKELGVSETEDVKELAKSVTDATQARVVIAFAKQLGVEVTDASKAAEAIQAHFAKPDAETQTKLLKLTDDLSKASTQLAEFDKTKNRLAELERKDFERSIAEQLSSVYGRIAVAKELGKMNKADEERILTVGKEGDKAILFSTNFSKDATYDASWQRQLDRIVAKLEELEARKVGFAVPPEKTSRTLGRVVEETQTDDFDAKKERESGKARALAMQGRKAQK